MNKNFNLQKLAQKLTGKPDVTINPPLWRTLLLDAQVGAARSMPYLAPIIMRLQSELVDKKHPVDTFATTPGLQMYVSQPYLETIWQRCVQTAAGVEAPQAAAIRQQALRMMGTHVVKCVVHEALHVFLNYWGRQGSRVGLAWNVAHDLEIAQYVLPQDALEPRHFGMKQGDLAENYYAQLPRVGAKKCCGNHKVEGEKGTAEQQVEAERAVIETAKRIVDQTPGGVQPGTNRGLLKRALEVLGQAPSDNTLRQLQGSIVASGARDYSYRRPSRRGVPGGIILPAMVHKKVRAACVLDVSGSMEGSTEQASSRVLTIVRSIGVNMAVVAWDTVPQAMADVRTARDLAKLHFSGGGTDMRAAIFWAAKRWRVDRIFVVTDGQTGWPSAKECRRLPPITVVPAGQWIKPPTHIEWVRAAGVQGDQT